MIDRDPYSLLVDSLSELVDSSNTVLRVTGTHADETFESFQTWMSHAKGTSNTSGQTVDVDAIVDFCADIASYSLADSTRARYKKAVEHFQGFLAFTGSDVNHPSPQSAVMFIGLLMRRGRLREYLVGDKQPLAHSGLVMIRSAIAEHYDRLGLVGLTRNPHMRALFRGYARLHGRAPRRAPALLLPELERVLRYVGRPSVTLVRDRAIVGLLTTPGALTPTMLAKLDSWEKVAWPANEGEPLTITGVGARPVVIRPGRTLDVCPAELLRNWFECGDGTGFVFPGQHVGAQPLRPLSRPAFRNIVLGHLRPAGLPTEVGPIGSSAHRARLLAGMVDIQHDAVALLTRVIFTVGVSAELRRSELAALKWGDIRRTDNGVLVTIRRSKTDQTARGATVHMTAHPDRLVCPVDALQRWKNLLDALGAPVDDESPILRKPRNVTVGLQPEGVSDIVNRSTREAGLEGHFTGHTLRASLPTIASLAGYNRDLIAQHGRRTTGSLDIYVRLRDALSADTSRFLSGTDT